MSKVGPWAGMEVLRRCGLWNPQALSWGAERIFNAPRHGPESVAGTEQSSTSFGHSVSPASAGVLRAQCWEPAQQRKFVWNLCSEWDTNPASEPWIWSRGGRECGASRVSVGRTSRAIEDAVIQNGEIPFSSRGVAPELALRYPNGQRSAMIGTTTIRPRLRSV